MLSGALDLDDPVAARPVQWIPPRWDWVDPLKDIQAQVLAMEAGITSRRKVIEARSYRRGRQTNSRSCRSVLRSPKC